jgi:GntR family transcriptional regulator
LLEAILEQRFEKRLPPEDVLAEMMNVSRTTIRSALQSLEEYGIVSRKRAIGTTINGHVRASALALQRLVGYDTLLRDLGYPVRSEVSIERRTPSEGMIRVFKLGSDCECLVTSTSYYAAEHVAIAVRDIVPRESLRTESFTKPLPASLHGFSALYCRTPIDHAVVQITAMTKDKEEGSSLGIAHGKPFTRLNETHYSAGGEPVAFSLIDVDNEFVSFEVFRRG